jgi:fluoroquinolone resistance protein
MNKAYIEEKTFEKIDFSKNTLATGDYENCKFINCDFSNADISNIHFSECEFDGCNLSMVKNIKTTLSDVAFKNCKLLGMHFDDCNSLLFTVYFENCMLNLSSFYKLNLKKTIFKNCNLQEVDFTETDVSNSLFENCDLALAKFENTILEKADLRSSYNYSIDPVINQIKKAKFSLTGIAGLLDRYDIEIE